MRLASEFKEEHVKGEIKKILKSYGKHIHYFMPSASMFGKAGAHDFICCVSGRFVSIEAKKGNRPPTDMQIDFANDMQLASGVCLCINEDNLAECASIIKDIVLGKFMGTGHNFERWRK